MEIDDTHLILPPEFDAIVFNLLMMVTPQSDLLTVMLFLINYLKLHRHQWRKYIVIIISMLFDSIIRPHLIGFVFEKFIQKI